MTGISDRLSAIARITRRTIGSIPLARHAQEMVEQARELFGMDACVIRLWEGDSLVLLACCGLPEKSCHPRLAVNFGISEEILKRRGPLLVPDTREHPTTATSHDRVEHPFEFRTYAGAPLLAGDRPIGILGLYSIEKRDDLTESDLDCIAIIANSMSVAIANDGVYEQLIYEHEQLEAEMAARRRAEQLLARSEERLRLAAEAARMFAFEWDRATDRVTRSPHAADILGVSEACACDNAGGLLSRIHPDDAAMFSSSLDQLSPSDPTYKLSFRILRPDGQVVWLEESARGFFDAAGELVQLIGMAADVTEIRRVQREMVRMREDLARVGRIAVMGELTAAIAHEVNQPLGAVVVNAQACENLLNRGEPCLSEVREALGWIVRDAVRAADVVQRVREFLGRGRADRRPVDLNGTLRAVVGLLDDRIAGGNVAVNLQLDPQLPKVSGDATQLQQLVLNLLTNALDAVLPVAETARRITIASRQEGWTVHVSVEDSGIGIPAEDSDRLFMPMVSTKSEGMGMGLAICRSIVQAHDGQIWAERNPSGGSTFHFTIELTAGQE